MNLQLAGTIWQTVAVLIDNGVTQVSTALMGYVAGPFQYCVLAYLIIVLMIAVWSSDETAFMRFFRQIWLAMIIYTIASQAATYNTYVPGLVNSTTTAISAKLAGIFGASSAVTANSFDIAITKTFAVGLQVFKILSWSPKTWIIGISVPLYWILSAFACLSIFFVWMMSVVVTNFVVAFGPIFVACYFFPLTRPFFDGWFRCVVGGMLTQLFTLGWLAIFLGNLNMLLAKINTAAQPMGGSGVDDIATELLGMVEAAAMVWIFSAMVALSAYMALRISNGAHSQIARMPSPNWAGRTDSPGHTTHLNNSIANQGDNGSSPASSGQAGQPGAHPDRQYAFQRNVGGAE